MHICAVDEYTECSIRVSLSSKMAAQPQHPFVFRDASSLRNERFGPAALRSVDGLAVHTSTRLRQNTNWSSRETTLDQQNPFEMPYSANLHDMSAIGTLKPRNEFFMKLRRFSLEPCYFRKILPPWNI